MLHVLLSITRTGILKRLCTVLPPSISVAAIPVQAAPCDLFVSMPQVYCQLIENIGFPNRPGASK